MSKIPLYIESQSGHDALEVPENKIQEEVEKQLKGDKWVTVEKQDGSSEILAEQDIPDQEDEVKREQEEWAKKFENVKSATTTYKAKGG